LKENRKSEDQQSNFSWPTRRALGRKSQVMTARTFWDGAIQQLSTTLILLYNANPRIAERASSSCFYLWTSGSAGIAGIFLLALRARQRSWRRILCLTVLALFFGALQCSGVSNSAPVQHDAGTTPGSYKATLIIATSRSLVHQVGFHLVINKEFSGSSTKRQWQAITFVASASRCSVYLQLRGRQPHLSCIRP